MSRRSFGSIPLSSILGGLAGAVWGWALARALAEGFPASPILALGPTVGTALAAAVVAAWLARRTWPFVFAPLCLPLLYVFWPGVAPIVGWTLLGGSLALVVSLSASQRGSLRPAQDALPMCALAGIALALYLRTLGPTVGQADTFEFQVVAPTLGVAHPTGYPLYILCGKLFSLLPAGSVAWRVNLTSAVFAAVAVVLVYRLVRRLSLDQSTRSHLIPFLAALAFGVSRVFWSQAVVAEVYALHNLFVALVLWGLVRLIDEPGSQFPLYLLFLSLGLSFANHLTTALLLPAVGLTLFLARPRLSMKSWLVAAGLFVLGLSLYSYIYLRWPMLHDGVWMSPGEFWRYITGQQFGGALRLDAWRTDPTRYEIVGRLLREPFGWPGLALSALGLAWLAVKQWRVALVTGVTFAAFAWYALSYYVPDVSVFFLPAHLILAVWLGVGAAALVKQVERGDKALGRGEALVALSISLFSLLPLSLIWTNLPAVDQSGEREAYAWGDAVLNLPIAPDAAILADSARIAPLYYLQRIEGRRPDLDLLVLADEATYRAELETRVAAGQTVYLARFLPGLEGRYHLRSLGPLTEVGATPLDAPPAAAHAAAAQFGPTATGGEIEWIAYSDPSPGPDGGLGLTLYWRAPAALGEVYHVRLRLIDGAGQVWWQETGGHAANNYYPTAAWRPGEVVADYHEIPPLVADPTVGNAEFSVQVGWFRPFSAEGLAAEAGAAWVTVADVQPVWEPDARPTHDLRVWLGWPLLGATLPDVAAAGAPVEVTLHWSTAAGTVPSQLALAWADARGHRTPVHVVEQWGLSRLAVQAPAVPGDYRLWLSATDGDGQPVSARCGWLARPSNGCAIATLRVSEAATAALGNLDGKMLLVSAEVGRSALSAGQSMPVTLQWAGLQSMDADYTVSVQLVGPDGRLYGQTDAWPVQGTLPTSQWTPGQRISDPYTVALSPDAPPGVYRVGVVVYLLATQTRLPVRDAAGQIVGDVIWVGELTVDKFP